MGQRDCTVPGQGEWKRYLHKYVVSISSMGGVRVKGRTGKFLMDSATAFVGRSWRVLVSASGGGKSVESRCCKSARTSWAS